MYLLSLLFGIVLLPEAYTLKCYVCMPGTSQVCKEKEMDCPLQGQKCGTVRIVSYAGVTLVAEIITKSCFTTDQCVEGSVNFGVGRTQITSKCCSTALCNAGAFNGSVIGSAPNGKKCFTCNGPKCDATLDCRGTEDHCITSSMTMGAEKLTMKGCASGQICSNHAQIAGSIGAGIRCCEGHLCNSASTAGATLTLLLAPLIASVIF